MNQFRKYPCGWCGMALISPGDLPCKCPNCGVKLTKIVHRHPRWLEDIMDLEDRRFFEMVEQIMADRRVFLELDAASQDAKEVQEGERPVPILEPGIFQPPVTYEIGIDWSVDYVSSESGQLEKNQGEGDE